MALGDSPILQIAGRTLSLEDERCHRHEGRPGPWTDVESANDQRVTAAVRALLGDAGRPCCLSRKAAPEEVATPPMEKAN